MGLFAYFVSTSQIDSFAAIITAISGFHSNGLNEACNYCVFACYGPRNYAIFSYSHKQIKFLNFSICFIQFN